ncbi:MAG TPA: hypothetical protein VFY13_04525 [Luteolibacter sp.]|nr:hypothetical protein [Luteolibacter sp.]
MNPCEPVRFDHASLAILYVDPDPVGRRYFRQLFKERFHVLDAADPCSALAVLRRQGPQIGVVILDEALLEERNGLLKTSLAAHPGIIHVVSVGFARLTSDLGAYYEADQLRHIIKPWDVAHVEIKLRRALEFQLLRQRRDACARPALMVADGVG